MIKQISVFVENKKGRLHKLTKLLAENEINLEALTIADTAEFGILRCIVAEPERMLKIVKEAGFTATITDVIGVAVKDEAGGLANVLGILQEDAIGVEYLYCFVSSTQADHAFVILRVDDNEAALRALKMADQHLITQDMLEQR